MAQNGIRAQNNHPLIHLFDTGGVGRPLILAGVLSCVLILTAIPFLTNGSILIEYIPSFAVRYMGDNRLCQLIGLLFLLTAIFSLFQRMGFAVDHCLLQKAIQQDIEPPIWLQAARNILAPVGSHKGPLAYEIDIEKVAALDGSDWSELYKARASVRLAFIQYVTWTLPLLGFIGTVIGISDAIGNLDRLLGDSNGAADLEKAIQEVIVGLDFAFDTTLVGLVAVIPIMGAYVWLSVVAKKTEVMIRNVQNISGTLPESEAH